MVRRNIVIPDELDQRFRAEVGRRKGPGKGVLSEAFCEAMELWIIDAK